MGDFPKCGKVIGIDNSCTKDMIQHLHSLGIYPGVKFVQLTNNIFNIKGANFILSNKLIDKLYLLYK